MAHVGPFPKHKLGQVVGFHWNFSISITSLAFRRQHEGKIAPRRKKSTIEMDPSTSVRRPLQDVTNGCVLRAASSRLAMRDGATMSLSLSAGDASGGCGRASGASAPADSCAVYCCRQRAGAIGDWCVAARGRASLARQSWMPCRGSGRPRLAPASASS